MQMSNVSTIFFKELKDTLRDRRTLMFMLLIPMVAIPALTMGITSLMMSKISEMEEEVAEIAVEGAEYLPAPLATLLEESEKISVLPTSETETKNLTVELQEGNIQAVVQVPEGFAQSMEQEEKAKIQILYDEAELKSEFAERRIKGILDEYKDGLVQQRLQSRGVEPDLITPFDVASHNVASMQKIVGEKFGAMLPYVIIIMCFLGAMYPAIDLAAGEKERGTLETLLVSPATRGEFVIGKYLVILLTGVVAGLMSLGSLAFSMSYIVDDVTSQLGQMLAVELDLQTIALVLLIIVPLAGIFAGILLTVSVFARSFKEAQSYVTALNMMIILPAIISMLPGFEMSYSMSLVPVLNASVIMKKAIAGTVEWNFVLTALAANTTLAILALVFCRKWFERESVIFRM